jgi:hypothetical protein
MNFSPFNTLIHRSAPLLSRSVPRSGIKLMTSTQNAEIFGPDVPIGSKRLSPTGQEAPWSSLFRVASPKAEFPLNRGAAGMVG